MGYARKLISPSQVSPGGIVLSPELMLPDYVYAPGKFPLWAALQTLDRNTRQFQPIGNYWSSNFADTIIPKRDLLFTSSRGTDELLNRASSQVLEAGTDHTEELVATCPRVLQPAVLSFVGQAASPADAKVRMSGTGRSRAVRTAATPGMNIALSSFVPANACSVSIKVANIGHSGIRLVLHKPILIAHPAVLIAGTVHSSSMRIQ